MKHFKTLVTLIYFTILAVSVQAQVTVNFIAPLDGTEFDTPHDLYVLVEATGNIRKVTLYLNGTLVRDEKVAPYEWGAEGQNDPSLKGLTDGNYTLRAVAQDRSGEKAETSIAFVVGEGGDSGSNRVPSVTFTRPTDGQNFTAPANVPVTVEATDADGTIEKVDLYMNDALVRTEGGAPYEWGKANQNDPILKNMTAGSYTLRAVATDNLGATGEATIAFTVDGGGNENILPTVSITTPTNGQNFLEGDNLTVNATASDADGTITGVELFYDGVTQGVDNTSPYNWTINNLSLGNHDLRVVTTDNDGGTDEEQISIIVEQEDDGGGNGEEIWSLNGTTAFYNNGRVGIGTNTPDEMLTVAGKIHSREVVVTVAAGADFVFEKDYELLPLDELAAYLENNQHLPEIASAKEMEEKGLELSQFNIKLLQKVEELTLYTIQIHKNNQVLQENIELLNAQNELLKKELEALKKQSEKSSEQ